MVQVHLAYLGPEIDVFELHLALNYHAKTCLGKSDVVASDFLFHSPSRCSQVIIELHNYKLTLLLLESSPAHFKCAFINTATTAENRGRSRALRGKNGSGGVKIGPGLGPVRPDANGVQWPGEEVEEEVGPRIVIIIVSQSI